MFAGFAAQLKETLAEAESARDAHRTYIAVLTGLAFAGLLGLAAADYSQASPERQNAVIQAETGLAVSFLTLYIATAIQGYKAKRWQDVLADCLMETGTLALLLAVAILVTSFQHPFGRLLSTALMLAGIADSFLRAAALRSYFSALRRRGDEPEHDEEFIISLRLTYAHVIPNQSNTRQDTK